VDNSDSGYTEIENTDLTIRIRAIRARLPGQMASERLDAAALSYGPLYTLADIRQRVAASIPRRIGFVRGATFEPIETYQATIPDHALVKYDDALQTGLFSRFLVATPTYYRERELDPWIIAEVLGNIDRWVVVTQWDV
jgi:hypothetical protein